MAIALRALQTNPALLKLDLYCKGMRLDDSCFVEQDGGRKILRTRAGLGSGLELILPGNLWTNVPTAEAFAQKSPFMLHKEWRGSSARYVIKRDGEFVMQVELSPRPDWYDRKTTTGKDMTRVGTLQGTYLDILEPYITRLKQETGVLIGVQTPPHRDLKRYDHLREIGVNRVSFCFEIYDRQMFQEICPGKHREYGLDFYLEAVRYCATLGKKGPRSEPWVTNGEIIAGLEPAESSIKAIDWVTSVGAIPTVCVFRPLIGTDLENTPPPETEDMIPVFRRLYEATMEAGMPIGCAPNVHVSLVMLPEECRSLSSKRYPFQTMKLKAMAKMFEFQFMRRLAAKDAARARARESAA